MAATLNSRVFGYLAGTGGAVEAWTLNGQGGLVVEVITYGGIVTRLLAPDRDGHLADVVLGFNDLDSYLAGHPYFGAIVGRVAGRITGAAFSIDGALFRLPQNDPPNHLHGGVEGFDKKIWTAIPESRSDGAPSLRLIYCSPEGEEGYPGSVNVSIIYTVTNDNTFLIETEAVADRPTPINLTHHSYFNLAGEAAGCVTDHELQVLSDEFVITDEQMTLLGRVESVTNRHNDFRQPRRLGDVIPLIFQNHGDLYLVRKNTPDVGLSNLAHVAQLIDPYSGRLVNVFTTETHLQLYFGAALDASLIGKSDTPYIRHAGICLECHSYPDGANHPGLGDIILRPGHPKCQTTAYAFSTVARNCA
jgi:aldose 1-epimerase